MEECTFYAKVGACRHGNKCVRRHNHPSKSKYIILFNTQIPTDHTQRAFVHSVFVEIASISKIVEFAVAGNQSPHLKGNIYIAFENEEQAEKVLVQVNQRWLNMVPVFAELGPMDSMQRIVCREGDRCPRMLDCNYVHLMDVNVDDCFEAQFNDNLKVQ